MQEMSWNNIQAEQKTFRQLGNFSLLPNGGFLEKIGNSGQDFSGDAETNLSWVI